MESDLQENKKILVYCQMGKSRSVTIILNYLMTQENISYEMAFVKLLYVRQIRSEFACRLYSHRITSKVFSWTLTRHSRQSLQPWGWFLRDICNRKTTQRAPVRAAALMILLKWGWSRCHGSERIKTLNLTPIFIYLNLILRPQYVLLILLWKYFLYSF